MFDLVVRGSVGQILDIAIADERIAQSVPSLPEGPRRSTRGTHGSA